MLLLTILSIVYLYMWIQNTFIPYSTAWDANHEYMYFPKILAENAGIYRWNDIGHEMPWIWSSFITYIFSLTGCTNWWFGLSPDNIAVSMNNLSSFLVLILWLAVIFQISILCKHKNGENSRVDKLELWWHRSTTSKNNNTYIWIIVWWSTLLIRLTSGMGAFLVIVDNKSDLWVMFLSLLALLVWLIFLCEKINSTDKKLLLKYIVLTGVFFWFATISKITASVDFVIYRLLLICLSFSPLLCIGLWITIMGILGKMHIFTSDVILSETNATRFIIIWLVVTIVSIIIHCFKLDNRKNFLKKFMHLIILWITFLATLLLFKLPRSTVNLLSLNKYSFLESLKDTFLVLNENYTKVYNNSHYNKFLALNSWDIEMYSHWEDDSYSVVSDWSYTNLPTNDITYKQCTSVWDIYSRDELYENLWSLDALQANEDLWRYIWYGWMEFRKVDIIEYETIWTGDQKTFNFFRVFWPKLIWDNWINNLTASQISQLSELSQNWIKENNIVLDLNLSYWLLKKIRPASETCYWFNHDAKVLCNNADVINNFKIDDLRAIYNNEIKNKKWDVWLLLKNAIDTYNKAESEWKIINQSSNSDLFHDEIVKLRLYYQSHSIYSTKDSIFIPYRYLVPLNISFNRTIQNLSSYYTDIGYVWIIIYILLIFAFPYSIIKRDKLLTSITLTTLIWRWIRWIIWSAILRYGTVLVSRTMITLAVFLEVIFVKGQNNKLKILPYVIAMLVLFFFLIQILFNFLRIASQWANREFVWYKWNVGLNQILDDNLESKYKTKYWYNWKDIFNLQFPQYNPIINALEHRQNNDGAIVAGTYLQYFLKNQWNVEYDWLLTHTFWWKISDGDLCKTYRRLKKNNVRYIILDPNLWTVASGEWNETLFYRFFWKLNRDETNSEIDWTIISLIKLYKYGYLELLSTNNLWAKYAFTIDDSTLRSFFGENLTDEDLILKRAKMAVLQYFNDANLLFNVIEQIFVDRVINDGKSCLEDISSIYWFEIDSNKVFNVAQKYLNKTQLVNTNLDIKDLNQSERNVLVSYLNIRYLYQQDPNGFKDLIENFLLNSISSSSQVIAVGLIK